MAQRPADALAGSLARSVEGRGDVLEDAYRGSAPLAIELTRAVRHGAPSVLRVAGRAPSVLLQRQLFTDMDAMWKTVYPEFDRGPIDEDPVLRDLYDDAALQLPYCGFEEKRGQQPQVTSRPGKSPPFVILWDHPGDLDADYFVGAVIHELAHVASARMYHRHGVDRGEDIWSSVNLPAPGSEAVDARGRTERQARSIDDQAHTIEQNYQALMAAAEADLRNETFSEGAFKHVVDFRITYASTVTAIAHNETVLMDIMYYLARKGLAKSQTYELARRMLEEANTRRRAGSGVVKSFDPASKSRCIVC